LEKLVRIYRWLPAALCISFLPVAAALMQGQDSIILLSLLASATSLARKKRDMAAGVFVGLGMFKFPIVVPIGVLFFLWRRWRFSVGFACSAGAAVSASLWLVGLSDSVLYVRSLLSMSVSGTIIDQIKYGIDPLQMPNVRGLVAGTLGSIATHSWIQFITFAVSAVVFLWVAVRGAVAKVGAYAMGMAMTTGTALSYHFYIHDMSVLLIPILLMLNRFIDAESAGDSHGRTANRLSVAMFTAPAIMSIAPFHFYLVSLFLLSFLYFYAHSGAEDAS
jgi:hypothetical protein